MAIMEEGSFRFLIRVSNRWKKTTCNMYAIPQKKLRTSSRPGCWGCFSPSCPPKKGGLGWCCRAEWGECALWSTPATLLLLGAWKVVAGCGAVWPIGNCVNLAGYVGNFGNWSAMENVPVIKRTKRVASRFVIQPTFEFHRYENQEP